MMNFLEQYSIYQDNDILIINKPAGILTVPGKEIKDSILTRLQKIIANVLLIHRLDRDTSGLLVFALNKLAQNHISKQFQARTIEKLYTAVVSGYLTGQGEINIPVVYDETRPPLHVIQPDYDKPAITCWQVIEHLKISDLPVTRLLLKPITGRSHQLRVHCQYLGHAIVGDTLYANMEYQAVSPVLCLHATQLNFIHPRTGQEMKFYCPPDWHNLDLEQGKSD